MKYSMLFVRRNARRELLDVFVKNGHEERYLVTCKFRTSIYKRFRGGVALNNLFGKKASNENYAVAQFIKRILPTLKFFENEWNAELFRSKKALAERNRKLIKFAERELDEEYADELCANF